MSDPSASPAPPRRFRFGLRSLFVLVTVVAVGCWVVNSLTWIRQRREALESFDGIGYIGQSFIPPTPVPGGLWIFGESGVELIAVLPSTTQAGVERIERLFPEAQIEVDKRD